MTFKKLLRSFSRAGSQRLGILMKSGQAFLDRLPLGRCFCGFVQPILEYCYAVWCSAVYTHPQLQDPIFSVASYLTGGVFVNLDLPVRVTHGALVVHRYNYATPRCRTSQYHLAFILFPSCQYLFLTILVTFDGVVPPGLRAGKMIFYRLSCSLPILSPTVSLSRLSFYTVWYYMGWDLRTDRVLLVISLSQPCITNFF